MKRVVVIGGGVAGLAAAHRLTELSKENSLPIEIVLVESTARLGGSIATEQIGDYLVEAGPDSFITEKPWALQLCERIGLASRLVSTQAAHQKIYVVQDGKLVHLPDGFFLLAPTRFWPFIQTPLFSLPGKLRIASELFWPRGEVNSDESLGSFVRRRFGREALERVAQPLVGGIYAADPDRLSLNATMPRFKEMERKQRSVIYAMWKSQRARNKTTEAASGARWSLFVTLAGGMQELIEGVARRLPEGALRMNSPATELLRDANGTWRIVIAGKENIVADAVILAAPAFSTGHLLKHIDSDAATELTAIPYASTATVSLAYRDRDFPHAPDSFGFVVPAIERRKIMACTFSSLKYPGRAPAGSALLRAFVGGSLQPELFDDNDEQMERNVRDELKRLLGVSAAPQLSRVWRHPQSMPQYHLGHDARIKRIEAALSRFSTLALAGSAYHGVGISDCIRTGEQAATDIFAQLSANP